jgi:hypothetical protein
MSQGFMMEMELATCHVLKDLASPVPVERYMVTFATFYE